VERVSQREDPDVPTLLRAEGYSAITATKQGLMIFSHALEEVLAECNATGDGALVIAAFQRRPYFDHEAERYAQLAADGATVVVAFVGSIAGLPPGVHGVSLPDESALAGQWVLAVLDDHLGAALVVDQTGDLGDGPGTMDAARMFTGGWSFDRTETARIARDLIGQLSFGLESHVLARASACIARVADQPLDPAVVRAARVTELLVSSIDQQLQRAGRLNAALTQQRHRAEVDPLTGLHNRNFLSRFLGGELGSSPVELTALLVDLDRLKAVNDTYGHSAGDAAIVGVAEALRSCARPTDVSCRIGGDEFLLLLPGVGVAEGMEVGSRIVAAVAATTVPEPWSHVTLSVSIGVAQASPAAIPMDALDRALYEVKRSGRGAVAVAR
jgi:diguanylate cyclase (GGDEF)-like protein